MNCKDIVIDKNCNIIVDDNTYNCSYVQIYIAKLTTSKGSTPTQTVIKDDRFKKVVFKSEGDGFYTICKLTIPKDEMSPYYYKDGKFYHNVQEVYLHELLNMNPKVSGIEIDYMYYFCTCHLRKCFIKICQDIFNSQYSICDKAGLDGSLTYKRDLIWSTLNVIDYMVETDQMEEAQRLLERLTGCNGLCSSTKTNVNDCGCRK